MVLIKVGGIIMRYVAFLHVLLIVTTTLTGQELYSDSSVIKLELRFSQSNYWELLIQNKQAKIEIPATLIVNDSEVYDSVGVRFKGNSSYNIPNDKKPFNISLDSFIEDQKLWGYKTLNLSNSFMDPTFVREKISYDMFGKYMPAAKVGYVRLYLNGEYWGLYVNVQQINKIFLGNWFSSKAGNLYKGDPHGNLTWLGTHPEMYRRDYEKKTNEDEDDWTDLISMIEVLNNSSDLEHELPQFLNVDRALWYIALCNILANLDSYIFSEHNYYIYNNPSVNRFNLIPWDLNEAFACFPPHGFTLEQFEKLPIFFNNQSRKLPLLNRMLNVPVFRSRYLAHYRTILKYDFHADSLLPKIEYFQSLIKDYVQSDTKKLYPYNYFMENVTNPVTIQSNRIAPGLMTFVQNRRNFLFYDPDIYKITPDIDFVNISPEPLQVGAATVFSADVSDVHGIEQVNLCYKINTDTFSTIQMFDDGLHEDGTAADGIYGCKLTIPVGTSGALFKYYVLAENKNGEASFSPERAEFECYTTKIEGSMLLSDLVINEFMAGNDNTIKDPQGDFDDWVEIYNRSSNIIPLNGMYLTDDPAEAKKWALPDTFITVHGYLLIWADDDAEHKPGLHTNFKLSKDGEYIGLYDTDENDNAVIDSYTFGSQQDDVSEGRLPNGEGNFTFMSVPTPNGENIGATSVESAVASNPGSFCLLQAYPNPFNSSTTIGCQLPIDYYVQLTIYDILGKKVRTLINNKEAAGKHTVVWDGKDNFGNVVSSGVYFYQLKMGTDNMKTNKMLFMK